MDYTTIIVAAIAFCGTAVGSIAGIRASNKLVEHRLDRLEKKVDLHNNAVERIAKLEERCKSNSHRIEDLEKQIPL